MLSKPWKSLSFLLLVLVDMAIRQIYIIFVHLCPPQNEMDETQIQQAGDDVVLPTELAKMIAEDNEEEAHKQSVLGQLSNIQNVDIDQLKDKAQATLEDLKKQTENCSLMWSGQLQAQEIRVFLVQIFSEAELLRG